MHLSALALFVFATPALAADGAIEGVVFGAAGAPVAGVQLDVAGQTATTDADGAFALVLETGKYTVQLAGRASIEDVDIVEGQTTELLLTLDQDGSIGSFTLDEPESARVDDVDLTDPGTVFGTVTDGEEGVPVEGARVFVRGVPGDTYTDAAGQFELHLPAGPWEVTILKSGFATRTSPPLEVVTDQTTELDLELLPAGIQLEDFAVTAPAIVGGTASLLEERRDSASVADMLGAEQMSKSGDSNAASALRRVTGLTLVGGKYVYVRGLGERYSSTLLNGANLPSPEPERRVVPLDLFPAGVIDSIAVQKTFSPDMPAEFGGGTIQIRTRRAPAEPFVEIGLSGTYSTQTSLNKNGITYQGGPTDWLGIDGGYRALPPTVQKASDGSPLEESDMFSNSGYTADELETFGEAMPNRWKISKKKAPVDYGLSFSGGTRIDAGKHTFGFLAGGTYGDEWNYDPVKRVFPGVSSGEVTPKHRYQFKGLTRAIKIGGLATATWSYDDTQEITALSFISRISENETRTYSGYNDDVGGDIYASRLRWVEQQLLVNQFLGEHMFYGDHGIGVDWRVTLSAADRIEPDRRETRFDYEEGKDIWLLSDRPEGNQRFFSTLDDSGQDYGIALHKPIALGEEQDLRLGAGGGYVKKIRTVDSRRFKYMHKGERSRLDEVLSNIDNPEEIFAPENIGNDGFQFEEITRETDNYAASHTLISAYALVDVDLTRGTRLMTGARLENSSQRVLTYALFNPDSEPVLAELPTSDVLPAATLTQKLPADMQVRAGYGKTVSRPDFREMSPATFNDVTGGRQTFGNPDLKRATIDNYDLRWEWYPSPGESLSVAGFNKLFHDPIEQIVVSSAQESVSYANAKKANNVGVEADWRKDFRFLGDVGSDFYFAGNVALIKSQVEIGKIKDQATVQSSNKRALQGQSPYALNFQLGYDHPEGRQSFALLFNRFGRRIAEAGAQGTPDGYEASISTLDFVASSTLAAGFRLGFKAKNLLDPVQKFTTGPLVTQRSTQGRFFGLSLSWKAGG